MHHWSDNLAVTYTNWALNEPSENIGGGCVVMGIDGSWYDTLCSLKHSFICKITNGE